MRVGKTNGIKQSLASVPPISPGVNEIWYELDQNNNFKMEWFWNGTYWLSKQLLTATAYGSYSASNSINIGYENYEQNILLASFSLRAKVTAPNNSSNYWDIVLRRSSGIDTTIAGTQLTTSASASDSVFNLFAPLSLHLNPLSLSIIYFRFIFTKIGTPGSLNASPAFSYRLARL